MPLTFCDIATFYCQAGGGIRTYYDAKLDWFRRQRRHRYVLIVPGARSSTRELAPSASVVEVRGMTVGRGREGYRVFLDFSEIRAAIRQFQPDVLEAGDPWVSGPMALFLGRRGESPPLLASFFHTDPIPTYVEPLVRQGWRSVPCAVAGSLVRIASSVFYRIQSTYDVTMVSSAFLEERLRRQGVTRVQRAPFGVDPLFFEIARTRRTPDRPRRLLYVGRLDRDKQIDLLLAVLPHLLQDTDAEVTIAGTGAFRSTFERLAHPRLRYVGYVRDRSALAALYGAHDILLAPGAYETFGLAALEASAAGLIVVGPDRGGTGTLLREMESPFVFRAGDPEACLSAVRDALQADWAQASREGRALAARYGTWPDAIGRLVSTYETIVAANLRRAC